MTTSQAFLIGVIVTLLVALYVASYVVRHTLWRDSSDSRRATPPPETVTAPSPPAPSPPPSPSVRPSPNVLFESNDGIQIPAHIARRTHRLFFKARAWDHVHTLTSGVWVYHCSDGPTPRQVLRRARPDAEA